MSRTIGGPLAAHLATRAHARCKMMRIDLVDGTSLGLTDHDRVLNFDLGDGAIDYEPGTGIIPSAISASEGFETDNLEVSGPIGAVITLAGLLGGRYDSARVRLFEVNWKSLVSGPIRLFGGKVKEVRVEGGKFVQEIRSLIDEFNQSIGRAITPYCDADFCDARCKLDIADFTTAAEVTAVIDAMRFTVSYAGSIADDLLNDGTVLFTSGALDATLPVEIFDWAVGGDIQLFEPLPEAPLIGDQLNLRQGCPKTRAACRDLFANIVNFRGFPEVPGSDQALKYANPGSGGG